MTVCIANQKKKMKTVFICIVFILLDSDHRLTRWLSYYLFPGNEHIYYNSVLSSVNNLINSKPIIGNILISLMER